MFEPNALSLNLADVMPVRINMYVVGTVLLIAICHVFPCVS